MKRLIFPLLLLFFPAAFVVMQGETPTPRLDITGVVSTDLPAATVTVSVVGRTGQPVGGLTEADFTLSGELAEFAEIVRVENIRDDNLSFATVLVIDVSSSMSGRPFELAKEAAQEFINSIGANDPVAIIAFGSDIQLLQDYTTDTETLLSTIEALPLGGETNLYGAALAGVEKAAEAPTPRRAVILLSDGAHYLQNVPSSTPRSAGLETAQVLGVPVYTIGLGFGADRTYLQSLSETTNAQFFESPNPEQLLTIFGDLAALFRSLYVITLDVNVPLDGTEYDFTLQAETPNGATDEASSVLRAPIPVPLVNIMPQDFEAAIDSPTEFTASLTADEEIVSASFELDGSVVGQASSITPSSEEQTLPITFTDTFSLDPFAYPPGNYALTYSATDASGDTGSAEIDFEIAPLPAVVTVSTDLSTLGEISQPTTITLEIGEQTPTTGVQFSVDGEEFAEDTEVPFEFTLDPAAYTPGEPHTLTIEVTSESGAVGTIEQIFTVAAFAPEVIVTGLEADQLLQAPQTVTVEVTGQTSGTEVVFAVDGQILVTDDEAPFEFTLEPFDFDANQTHVLQVTAINAGGQSTTIEVPFRVIAPSPTPTLTPTATFTPTFTPTPTIDFPATDAAATQIVQTTLDAEATSDTISTSTAEVLATANAASTSDAISTADAANALATQDAATLEAEATVNAQATLDIQATADAASALATQDAATLEAEATANAQATLDIQATADTQDAQATLDASTLEAEATVNAQATLDIQATADTQDAQATLDASTLEAEATVNAQATDSALSTATADTQDAQATLDASTLEAEATVNAQATDSALSTATADTQAAESANLTVTAQLQTTSQAREEQRATQNALLTVTAQAPTFEAGATQTAELAARLVIATRSARETASAVPTETLIPTETILPTNTALPTSTFTGVPTETLTATILPTNTTLPTATFTGVPTETLTATILPTNTASAAPTNTLEATATLTATSTEQPTDAPTDAPTEEVTPEITLTLALSPTDDAPTQVAQIAPSATIFDPTVTPVQPTEVTAPTTPEDNTLPLLAIGCGVLLLILLLLFFLITRRRGSR